MNKDSAMCILKTPAIQLLLVSDKTLNHDNFKVAVDQNLEWMVEMAGDARMVVYAPQQHQHDASWGHHNFTLFRGLQWFEGLSIHTFGPGVSMESYPGVHKLLSA